MRIIRYFFEYIAIIILFSLFKLLGYRIASELGYLLGKTFGPLFRSKKIIHSNIKKALPKITSKDLNKITKLMWNNYGRTFAEYIFIKDFRQGKLRSEIGIEGKEILNEIKKQNKQVVFISGHLSNFELMAMCLEDNDIKLSAIYRPLNNIFLNKIMERIRAKYICKYQIKKGIGGIKKLIKFKKKNFSTALMIDQRVSEGIRSDFFGTPAFTTTIPAQIIKKFNCEIVPVHIERYDDIKFNLTFDKPIKFDENTSTEEITLKLNKILEIMVLKDPSQWILTHNRWK